MRRSAVALTAAIAAIALTGCSQVSGVIEQLLPERTTAHTLAVGECFNDTVSILTSDDAVDIPRENCTLEHDNEVIASIQLEGEKFPGDDTLLLEGFETCLPEFEQFIGVGFEEAGTLDYDFFVPSNASWALGDREVLCFVFDSAAQTAYTLKGQGAERAVTPPATEAEPEPEPEGDS